MLQQDESTYVDGHMAFLRMAVPQTAMSLPSLLKEWVLMLQQQNAVCVTPRLFFAYQTGSKQCMVAMT